MQVGRDLQELCSPTSSSNKGQLWDQSRLLRCLFSQILKTFKDDDCTASLGSCPTSLLGCLHGENGFPYIQSEPLLFQLTFLVSWLPTIHCDDVPAPPPQSPSCRYEKPALRSPEAISSPGWTSPLPSASTHRSGPPAWQPWWHFAELAWVCRCLLFWGAQNMYYLGVI